MCEAPTLFCDCALCARVRTSVRIRINRELTHTNAKLAIKCETVLAVYDNNNNSAKLNRHVHLETCGVSSLFSCIYDKIFTYYCPLHYANTEGRKENENIHKVNCVDMQIGAQVNNTRTFIDIRLYR